MTGGRERGAFTSSCTSTLILVYQCNMRDFSSLASGRKRRKNMTIAEVLKKAVEGGYHINGADEMDTDYSGASSDYSAWTRKDNQSSFLVAVEETFLDPHFWQALGRALEWNHAR